MQITEVLLGGSPNWVDIEETLEAFEASYHSNGSAKLEEYLTTSDDPNYAPLLAELIRIDLELSRRYGRPHSLDWHLSRFPHLLTKKEILKDLAFEEYRLRVAADENPSATEYAKRYGIDTSTWGSLAGPAATNVLRDVSVVKTPTGSALVSSPSSRAKFPQEGDLFAGFRLRSELGRGAFARVYLAEQGDLANRPVALKVSQQFVEESQTLAQLQHTNIVPIHSVHKQGRFHAVCMPYLGRTTLADIINTWGRGTSLPLSGHGFVSTVVNHHDSDTVVPDTPGHKAPQTRPADQPVTPLDALKKMTHEDAALWVAAELADGLAHAHQRGIWHRDLKPANVLLGEDGVPRLLDFNLSVGTRLEQQAVGGTPFYMAPEQLRAMKGEAVQLTAKIDQYALGLVLFELLTGQSPQETEANLPSAKLAMLLQRRLEPPKNPRICNPNLRAATAEIVLKCLAPNPAKRYSTADQLRDELRRQLTHQRLKFTPEPSARERWSKFRKRNPRLTSVTFLSVLSASILIGAAALVLVLSTRLEDRKQQLAGADLRKELLAHRVSLFGTSNEQEWKHRQKVIDQTLKTYGLSEADRSTTPTVRLDWTKNDPLRRELLEFHLFVAASGQNQQAMKDWLKAASRYVKTSDERATVERLDAAIQAPTDSAVPPENNHESRQLRLLRQHRYRELLSMFDEVRPRELREFEWVAKAQAHRGLGEYAEAAACCTTAMAKLDQTSAALLAFRGRCFFELRQFERALADLNEAIVLEPSDPTICIDQGLTYRALGKHRLAKESFERSLELWPTHTRLHFLLADAYRNCGEATRADAAYARGLIETPDDDVSWISRGMAHLNRGKYDLAKSDFEQALLVNRDSRDARQNLAAVLGDGLNKPLEAIRVLTELLERRPDDLLARAGRGVYFARIGKREEAHADAEGVLKHQPSGVLKYQVAGIYSLTSATHPMDSTKAIQLLVEAFREGAGLEHVANDPELRPLMKTVRFQKILEAARRLDGEIDKKVP